MSIFLGILGTVIKQVAKRNKKNDSVKTADPVVFEEVQKKVESVNTEVSSEDSRAQMFKDYYEKIREAQAENEASQEIETADKSVYEDLVQEIERLKLQVEHQGSTPNIPQPHVPQHQAPQVVTAWNSTGGSIQARSAPEMGAPKSSMKIPDNGVFNVLEYSENSIILDGEESRFVLVESNNQKGWILESYLNFN